MKVIVILILWFCVVRCDSLPNDGDSGLPLENNLPPQVELVIAWSENDLFVNTIGVIRGEPAMFVQTSLCGEEMSAQIDGGCGKAPYKPDIATPSPCSKSGSTALEYRSAMPLTGFDDDPIERRLFLDSIFSAFASELPVRFAYDQNACAVFNEKGSLNNWPRIVGVDLKTPIYKFVY